MVPSLMGPINLMVMDILLHLLFWQVGSLVWYTIILLRSHSGHQILHNSSIVMLVEACVREKQTHTQKTCLFLLEQISGPSRTERTQCSRLAIKWLAGLLKEQCHIGAQWWSLWLAVCTFSDINSLLKLGKWEPMLLDPCVASALPP